MGELREVLEIKSLFQCFGGAVRVCPIGKLVVLHRGIPSCNAMPAALSGIILMWS